MNTHVVVLFALGLVSSCSVKSTHLASEPGNIVFPAAVTAQGVEVTVTSLTVASFGLSGPTGARVKGTLFNGTDEPVWSVEVTVPLYDGDDLIGSLSGRAHLVAPGVTRRFGVDGDGPAPYSFASATRVGEPTVSVTFDDQKPEDAPDLWDGSEYRWITVPAKGDQ